MVHLILAVEILDGESIFTIDEMVTEATAWVDVQLLTVQATARVDVHGPCQSAGVNLPWSEMLPRREIVFQPLNQRLDRRCQRCDSCSVSQSCLSLMNLRVQAMECGTCCSRVFVASVDRDLICVSCHGSGILRFCLKCLHRSPNCLLSVVIMNSGEAAADAILVGAHVLTWSTQPQHAGASVRTMSRVWDCSSHFAQNGRRHEVA